MLDEFVTDELIGQINMELEREKSKLEKWVGVPLRRSEIDVTMIGDIYKDYACAPMLMVDHLIRQVAPFLDELGVQLFPCVGNIEKEYCYSPLADWDQKRTMHICSIDLNGYANFNREQRELVDQLTLELINLYHRLNFRMTLYLSQIAPGIWNDDNPIYRIVAA
ncbi:hypothetical protein [Alicyclobacillus acidiphilus]|uniref:hypothetical protein n=1 Tax=Alicyclobacillus acidiphilus TaxID=182455 RepID=UPI0008351C57|nr:hypothetical protein [Alicyclobacillus acidiphilus]